jgi:GT2 family glycosyltransferase
MGRLVTVVVVTRNRPELLRATVGRVREALPGGLPLLVVDDASDEPVRAVPGDGAMRVLRHESRAGLVAARNGANLAAGTPFVLSLDDDSWPVEGDLGAAVDFLSGEPDVLALAFPIRRPGGGWQVSSAAAHPYPVRAFVGCAHLLRVGHFRALGGYGAAVVHQGEEMELAARASGRGLRCVHFPGFVVHHEHTAVARDPDRVLFHGMRNKARFARAYCPAPLVPWSLAKCAAEAALFAARHRRTSPVRGLARGFFEKLDRTGRAPLTLPQWRRWRALPYA